MSDWFIRLVAASVVLFAISKGVIIYCTGGLWFAVVYVVCLCALIPFFVSTYPRA